MRKAAGSGTRDRTARRHQGRAKVPPDRTVCVLRAGRPKATGWCRSRPWPPRGPRPAEAGRDRKRKRQPLPIPNATGGRRKRGTEPAIKQERKRPATGVLTLRSLPRPPKLKIKLRVLFIVLSVSACSGFCSVFFGMVSGRFAGFAGDRELRPFRPPTRFVDSQGNGTSAPRRTMGEPDAARRGADLASEHEERGGLGSDARFTNTAESTFRVGRRFRTGTSRLQREAGRLDHHPAARKTHTQEARMTRSRAAPEGARDVNRFHTSNSSDQGQDPHRYLNTVYFGNGAMNRGGRPDLRLRPPPGGNGRRACAPLTHLG